MVLYEMGRHRWEKKSIGGIWLMNGTIMADAQGKKRRGGGFGFGFGRGLRVEEREEEEEKKGMAKKTD